MTDMTHSAEKGLPQPVGRPQGGLKSDAGRAAYWRMNYEAAIKALADLIAENTENVTAIRDALESLDDLCAAEDRHGDIIRAHEVRGAVTALRCVFPSAECAHDPRYSRSICGECGGQESWCDKCHVRLCECVTPSVKGN